MRQGSSTPLGVSYVPLIALFIVFPYPSSRQIDGCAGIRCRLFFYASHGGTSLHFVPVNKILFLGFRFPPRTISLNGEFLMQPSKTLNFLTTSYFPSLSPCFLTTMLAPIDNRPSSRRLFNLAFHVPSPCFDLFPWEKTFPPMQLPPLYVLIYCFGLLIGTSPFYSGRFAKPFLIAFPSLVSSPPALFHWEWCGSVCTGSF